MSQYLFRQKHFFLYNRSTVHFPRARYQIVSFIHQEEIVSLRPIRKITFQAHIRVKDIIIIADDPIHKRRNIEAELKRADLKFFRIL